MRILGFSKKWSKLSQPEFTTFRFARKDKDWEVGELVQIIYKPRSKDREKLGIAEITRKESRNMVRARRNEWVIPTITEEEANADGFENYMQMWFWLFDTYGGQRLIHEPMNKLTLRWEAIIIDMVESYCKLAKERIEKIVHQPELEV